MRTDKHKRLGLFFSSENQLFTFPVLWERTQRICLQVGESWRASELCWGDTFAKAVMRRRCHVSMAAEFPVEKMNKSQTSVPMEKETIWVLAGTWGSGIVDEGLHFCWESR